MCGITGAVWSRPELTVSEGTLRAMAETLRHRGPDDMGLMRSEFLSRAPYGTIPGCGLGFRRLSIIDLEGGRQPMPNEDETVWVVFNGEIYNFPALRNRLEGAGHRFRTDSDTETIVHLYEDLGTGCFEHLNGMFAIAIWDSRNGQLTLARDRCGEKPLFYRHEPGRLSFGSELKALLQVPGAPREVDLDALDAYLTYQYVPHPQCIWRGYRKLPPGHMAVYRDDALRVEPYWRPDFSIERSISERDAIDEVRRLVEDAVTMRMRSDVPLGAFLSGGVDSSIVAATMQRASQRPVKTFTIGFAEADFDETPYAREVAEALGTEHHQEIVQPDVLALLPDLARHYDEPFADSSALPTWRLSQMTRKHVTVALSGDGGDELFAGYERYRAVRLAETVDRLWPLNRILASSWWAHLPASGSQRSRVRQFKRFCEAIAAKPTDRYLDWISIFNEGRRAELYADEFVSQLKGPDPGEFLRAAWRRVGRRPAAQCASLADLTTYLPCDLMTKVDIASMAHSLEARCPLLDHRLIEFAASLPLSLKLRFRTAKRLLRLAFADRLPKSVFSRRKMGFGVPLGKWFRGELQGVLAGTLDRPQAVARGWLRQEAIDRLRAEHQAGRFDHSARLWSLTTLEMWLREWKPS